MTEEASTEEKVTVEKATQSLLLRKGRRLTRGKATSVKRIAELAVIEEIGNNI